MCQCIAKLGIFIIAVFVLFFATDALSFDTANFHTVISLEGMHQFKQGDDPRWALPCLDDSSWKSIPVPGIWQKVNVNPPGRIGWYRIRFHLPERMEFMQPALMLGRVGNSDEVFLNGRHIGKTGVIGDHFVDATWIQRVYKIPKKFFKPGEENLFTVRVMNSYRQGGIWPGPVCIGELADLLAYKYKCEFSRKLIEIGLMLFLGFTLMGSLFLYLAGIHDSGYKAFTVLILFIAIIFGLDSLFLAESGSKTPQVQQVINAAHGFIPALGIIFLFRLYGMRVIFLGKTLVVLYGLISFGLLIPFSFDFHLTLAGVWTCLLPLTVIVCVYLAFQAWRKRLYESGPVLFGVAGIITGFGIETVDMIHPLSIYHICASEYGIGFFLMCIAYALTARYGRISKEYSRLSGKILEAHEEERKRLSREIHDGLGQALQSIKLYLQLLESNTCNDIGVKKEMFSTLMTKVTQTITEMRHIATDLRPSTLDELPFVDALYWYGRKFSDESGITFEINHRGDTEPPKHIKDHLYRIFQEALTNIRRHAGADHITVQITANGKLLSMKIEDNGQGFDTGCTGIRKNNGLGLQTIRERVQLIGGVFRIRSKIGVGTTLYMEVAKI